MCSDGWTDSHHETNSRFRKMCVVHDIAKTVIYCMEQNLSWETNMFSGSQEISRILLNPKAHYSSHKCPRTVPILNQLDSVYDHTSHFRKFHLNSELALDRLLKFHVPKYYVTFSFNQNISLVWGLLFDCFVTQFVFAVRIC
jgi:hypothetical protein